MRKKSKLKKRKIFAETYRDVETALKLNLSLNDEQKGDTISGFKLNKEYSSTGRSRN